MHELFPGFIPFVLSKVSDHVSSLSEASNVEYNATENRWERTLPKYLTGKESLERDSYDEDDIEQDVMCSKCAVQATLGACAPYST